MNKIKFIGTILALTILLLFTNKYFYVSKYHIPLFSVTNDKVTLDFQHTWNTIIESIHLTSCNI